MSGNARRLVEPVLEVSSVTAIDVHVELFSGLLDDHRRYLREARPATGTNREFLGPEVEA